MAAFSGMAGEIRSSTVSEQFDLSGYTESRATDLMIQAFGTVLDAPTSMVRFTFVVGGGKLVRGKYNDDLPKWINAALRTCDYEYDGSAAETLDSQGSFKQQHDTGKNLIYIIVYPKITWRPDAGNGDEEEAGELIDSKSPEYLVTAASLEVFEDILDRKLEFWRQRKECLKILQDAKTEFVAIEAKMMTGKPLDAVEQAKYDANCGEDDAKIAFLQNEIKSMVDAGELLQSEKEEVLAKMKTNMDEATAAGQAKKVETIKGRKEALEKTNPLEPRLRLGDKIQKIRVKVLGLKAVEEKGKNMSLTMADLQALGEKGELEDTIEELERKSRCWFETDEDFALRCAHETKLAEKAAAKKKPSSLGAKKGTGLGSGGKKGTAPPKKPASYAGAMSFASIGQKVSAPKKAAYAAAFEESDSD
jgi:hypothetical protein